MILALYNCTKFWSIDVIDLHGASFASEFETDANPGARPTVAMATGGGFPPPLFIVMDILPLMLSRTLVGLAIR